MKTYAQSCKSEFWQKIFRAEVEYLLPRLEGAQDVLSVGCGPATAEDALAGHGFRVTGLDVSEEALGSAPDSVRTVVARAEDMPFADSSFDAVIYVASLQFVADYRMALRETTRVLRPGGMLLILLLNPESGFFREKMRNPDSYVRKIRHADLKEIENAIAEDYDVRAEYCLGVEGDAVFESHERDKACLYAVTGRRRNARKTT